MVPQTIGQCAKAKNLGTFQQCHSESLSLIPILILSFFCIAGAIGCFWLSLTDPQSTPFWVSLIIIPLVVILMALIWNGYLNSREKWLYVYSNGFVYDHQGHIQSYHVEEILCVYVHMIINTSNGSNSTSYEVKLINGEQVKIKHGASLKSRVELYQRQLHKQLKKRAGKWT